MFYARFEYLLISGSVRSCIKRSNHMSSERHASAARSKTYCVPASAHQALTQTRDHLRLLAQLTEPKGDADSDVVYLSARALADCFDRLADDLDRVAEAIGPAGP